MKSTLLLSALACSALACAAPEDVAAPDAPPPEAAPQAQIDPNPASNPAWHHEIADDAAPLRTEVELPEAELPEPPTWSPSCRSHVAAEIFPDEDNFGPYVMWRYEDDCMNEALEAYLWIGPAEDVQETPFGAVEGVLYSADVDGEIAFQLLGEYTRDLATDELTIGVEIKNEANELVGTFHGRAATDAGVPSWVDGFVTYD